MNLKPVHAFLITLLLASDTAIAKNSLLSIYKTQQTGDATYFIESTAGRCTITPTLPLWSDSITYQVAIPSVQYAAGNQSAACGLCLAGTYLGTGSGNSTPPNNFTALVVDECPGCKAGDLDLAQNDADGRWDITWQAIDCPVGNNKLAYLLQGSNPFYLKLGVRNHRIGIKALQIQSQANTPYITASRTSDNFFICNSCPEPLQFPMPIRILGVNNQVINDLVPELTNDVLLKGVNQVQFFSIKEIIYTDGFDQFGF